MPRAACAATLALVASLAFVEAAPASPTWSERKQRAAAYAEARLGTVSFAVTTETGRLRGHHKRRVAYSASVLKAMLLVAYLRRDSVRGRALTHADRSLLSPMIRRSANEPANRIVGLVGRAGVNRVAERAGMRRFVFRLPIWGHSETTARDQARFFRRIDEHLPKRHRSYGMRLLASVVPSQRWGIPPVTPGGWRIYFKGGWGSGTGRVTHQVALLRKGDIRISLAVLTQWNPSHAYGTQTIRGVAKRLLRGL